MFVTMHIRPHTTCTLPLLPHLTCITAAAMCGVKLDVSDLVTIHVIFDQQWARGPQIVQGYQAIGSAHCTVQTSVIKSDSCQLCVSLQHQEQQWTVCSTAQNGSDDAVLQAPSQSSSRKQHVERSASSLG